MRDAIDRLAMSLAAGTSRRQTVSGLLAGAAALLPWAGEARNRRKKLRRRRKKFRKHLEFCREWCGLRHAVGSGAFQTCVKKAKVGKGECYASGPGHFCTRLAGCTESQECCPFYLSGEPVTEGDCCLGDQQCVALNATARACEFK